MYMLGEHLPYTSLYDRLQWMMTLVVMQVTNSEMASVGTACAMVCWRCLTN